MLKKEKHWYTVSIPTGATGPNFGNIYIYTFFFPLRQETDLLG